MPRNVRSWASAPPVPPPPTMRTWGASRDARGADRVIDASIAPRASRDALVLVLLFLTLRERAFVVLVLLGLLTLGEVAVLPVFHGVLLHRGHRKVATPVRRSLHPVERPRHGLLPERVLLIAL